MSLAKGKWDEIPKDAVLMNKGEAINHQLRLMKNWKKKSDTFAFRYGVAILGSVTALTGIYINSHYRLKFKLLNYGRLSSYLPICVLPPALAILFHTEFVIPDVVLQESCTVCLELRSSAIQSLAGCVLPAILAPASAIPLAIQYNTYDIPYITKEPMKVFRLWQKQTKPIATTLFAVFLFQAVIASVVTYFESKSVMAVNRKLMQLEKDLENYGKFQ